MRNQSKEFSIKLIVLAEFTFFILVIWSYLKKDYVELSRHLIWALVANIMIVIFFLQLIKENNYSEKQLSFNELTEVIPLLAKDDIIAAYYAKLAMDGFFYNDVVAKVYVKVKHQENIIFYGVVKRIDFNKFYKIK